MIQNNQIKTRKGTTPTFNFRLKNKDGSKFNYGLIADARITFKQQNKIVLEKKLQDCLIADGLAITLTQEETLKFYHSDIARVQLKLKLNNDKIISTEIYNLNITEILNTEVL